MPPRGSMDFMMGSSLCPVHWKPRSSKSICTQCRRLDAASTALAPVEAGGQYSSWLMAARTTVKPLTTILCFMSQAHCMKPLGSSTLMHLQAVVTSIRHSLRPWEATTLHSSRLTRSLETGALLVQQTSTTTATASWIRSTTNSSLKLDQMCFIMAWTESLVKRRRSRVQERLQRTSRLATPCSFRTLMLTSIPSFGQGGARSKCHFLPPQYPFPSSLGSHSQR
mmetsp:Transcript_14235/g.37884  ORF Transcript_14235/g.37884 Transcript_14235/m.37884 type:complete len:224 (-) Transcript_14235:115-786(-)